MGESATGGDEGWLNVAACGTASNRADEETRSLASARVSPLEMGADGSGSDDEDTDGAYEATERAAARGGARPPPLARGRPALVLALLAAAAAAVAFLRRRGGGRPSFLSSPRRPPPGADGVGHAAYDVLASSRLTERAARLALYRHRATGAEYLAFVPDATRRGPDRGGGPAGGYDPKPDKVPCERHLLLPCLGSAVQLKCVRCPQTNAQVFGVAFRTRPESSTGVAHILERESPRRCRVRSFPSPPPPPSRRLMLSAQTRFCAALENTPLAIRSPTS